jgi:multimeric flavodoxin WrbA
MNILEKIEFEYLFLMDFNLEMCRGCFSCVKNMSPVYCQNVTGLMKNFIDRLSYLFHRPRFFSQKARHCPQLEDPGLKKH